MYKTSRMQHVWAAKDAIAPFVLPHATLTNVATNAATAWSKYVCKHVFDKDVEMFSSVVLLTKNVVDDMNNDQYSKIGMCGLVVIQELLQKIEERLKEYQKSGTWAQGNKYYYPDWYRTELQRDVALLNTALAAANLDHSHLQHLLGRYRHSKMNNQTIQEKLKQRCQQRAIRKQDK